MQKFRVVLCCLLAAAVAIGAPAAALADTMSTFAANLSVTLTFTGAVPANLAVASAAVSCLPADLVNNACLPNAVIFVDGNAGVTQAVAPTSVFNAATNTLTFTAGPIAGFAGPGEGYSSAVSYGTSQTINLTNTGAARLRVRITGNYTYSLSATAALNPQAAAGASYFFRIDNTTNPNLTVPIFTQGLAVVAPPDSSSSGNNVAIPNINLFIAAGATSSINLDPFVSGNAYDVPEPYTIVLVLPMLLGFCLFRKNIAARITLAKEESHA